MEHSTNHLWTKRTWFKLFSTRFRRDANIPEQSTNCIQELYTCCTRMQICIFQGSLNGLGFCRPVLLWLCFDYAQNSDRTFPQAYASLWTRDPLEPEDTLKVFQFHELHDQTSKAVQRILSPGQSWWRSIETQWNIDIRQHSAKSCYQIMLNHDGEGLDRHAMFTWKNVKESIAGWSNWISGADSKYWKCQNSMSPYTPLGSKLM